MSGAEQFATAVGIAADYGLDPKTYRAELREQRFSWHRHNDRWRVVIGSVEHKAMLDVAAQLSG